MASDILMKHVAPALGTLVAWALFVSPLKAVLAVRQTKTLGALNPLPYVAMWANCAAWLVYSFLTRDPYVLVSNVPGILLATFMTLSCVGHADDRTRDRMLLGALGFTVLLFGAGAAVSFGGYSHQETVRAWGTTTVAVLVIFYSAPLSVLAEVFATRSSAALYLPFAAANCANGLLWSAYGLAVPDAFIYGPNLVGAVFGALQVALCLLYPSIPGPRYDKQLSDDHDAEAGSPSR